MTREMLGIAEGTLQDLHDDYAAVGPLFDAIMESNDRSAAYALGETLSWRAPWLPRGLLPRCG